MTGRCPSGWWRGQGPALDRPTLQDARLIPTLGPGSVSFLRSGLLVGVFVERGFLVNEPAVSRPQDQVQKAKNLHSKQAKKT